MKSKRIILIIILVTFVLSFTGCIGVNGNFKRVRNHVFTNLNDDYKKVVELSVGPTGMALAGTFVSFADDHDGEIAAELIRNVNRVQVGVYERRNGYKEDCSFEMVREISEIMERANWQYIVRTVDRNEMAAVFIRSNSERVHHMFVVAMSDEELVLTEVRGDLDKIVEIAIREQGLKFDIAHND